MLNFLRNFWPSILTFLAVVYATLLPHPPGAEVVALFPGYDKLIHAILMGGLFSALIFDIRRKGVTLSFRTKILTALSVAIFAVADEYVQHVVAPLRIFDLWDILAGFGGIILAFFIAPPVINRIFRKRSRKN